MIAQLIDWLAWAAAPVALICVIDDWFLRPRRQIAAAPARAPDPPPMSALYFALPVLVVAVVLRVLRAERMDFSAVLVGITLVSGLVWFIDAMLLRRVRAASARAAGKDPAAVPEPGTVDYARSFFPVAAVLLVLRSFVFEPYRIPSDSMMPTLLDGDFIVVNKYAYGLRMPVTHRKFFGSGLPQRSDVVVFRYPPDPAVNYIKRVVGMPGDTVQVKSDQLIINGEPVPLIESGRYSDGCYVNMRLAEEQLGAKRHKVMHCVTPQGLLVSPLPGCDRDIERNYVCEEQAGAGSAAGAEAYDSGDSPVFEIPAGHYLMIGDNRDNSADGRYWGFVDENLLVGKATRIWFNLDLQRSGGPKWSRIGARIE